MPLRLKSLELHGYKTFATRTFFEFSPGITAIVGPNGAGKSNVADALRWVLGEQSYSLLRGKKTEDMIFTGSEHRPRAGMAAAAISFDNTSRWLPVDYSEVEITRRAYRDGRNEYLLNSQHVRLRDMNELLAAAGLSERTYTMVGQGLVDASLALKADERRRLFEEAAGVGLYRVRREEALKRLESTLRNLERVQDIMTEIEPRLKTLERQARRANEYASAQSDLREVLREWYGYHWHKAQKELQEARENLHAQQARSEAARDALEKSREAYSQTRARLAELRAQIGAWHRDAAALHQEREAASVALAVLDERRRSLEGVLSGLTAERGEAAGQDLLAAERLTELDRELSRAQADAEEAAAQLQAAQAALQSRQQGKESLEGDLSAAREEVVRLTGLRAETQARIDALAQQIDHHVTRCNAATKSVQAAEAEVNASEAALRGLAEARDHSERAMQDALKEIDRARQLVEKRAKDSQLATAERAALLTDLSKLQTQLNVLEQAEQALIGYAEGARFLLEPSRQSQYGIRGALSGLLVLPAELETAVAAALGDAIDGVLIDGRDIDRALELLESEGTGRAVLMSTSAQTPQTLVAANDSDILGVASRLVQAPPDVRPVIDALLGATLIVRTRAGARRLQAGLPAHARIVTLRGEVFRGDGLITAGKPPSAPTLTRPREIRELAATAEEMTKRLSALDTRVAGAAAEVATASAQLSRHESELEQSRKEMEKHQAAEHKAALEAERQRQVLEWQRGRLTELLQEKAEAEAERERLESSVAAQEREAEMGRARLKALTDQLSELTLDEGQELVAYWSTRTAVTGQAAESARLRKAEHEALHARTAKQLQDLQSRIDQESISLEGLDFERTMLLDRERNLQAQISALQAQIEPAEHELESWQRKESGLEESESEAQRASSSADRALTQYEVDLVRRQEALESLRTRIVDDFGLVSFEYAASVDGPVPLPFEGLVEELRTVTELAPELEDQLNQRRARLRRLGLINPEAARDYEAESERYSFLTTQVQDLRQAEADLRQVISELDELTRQEFSRTYAAVDREFRQIFTRLFGGGSAHLSLTDPNNLIDTGIEIEARLPGRREQGLSLLSGGERSLTAIALVFALLKVSPTPVCVLDEVDAMLDEANVGRFRDLLSELSQETQFIVITHNRNTVQAADYIYGVTMGRDSASQVISLKLDEVSEEMLGASRV